MSKPVLAIIGRPNVGKSTFFNKIIGERRAIVEDTPGVTRDRIYAETEWNGKPFAIIDTGGIEPNSEDPILSQMREQAVMAMEMSDVILFMVDGKDGITTADSEVASMLRRTGKPVILVVNKVDNMKKGSDNLYDFYELGLGNPVPISSVNMLNFGDLLDDIVASFPDDEYDDNESEIKIAIIGKPNVGKSSLVNELTNKTRVIVSNIAGTTRDSIDMPFEYKDSRYTLIDTAGIRRKSKVSENIEKYSVIRAISAIERCDICVLMIDAESGITEQDKKIAGVAHEAGKGLLIVVNKWDLIQKETNTMRDYEKIIRSELLFASYAPVLFISVLKRRKIYDVIEIAKKIQDNRTRRISTGRLNNVIEDAIMMKQPPSDKGKRLKIYYTSQIGTMPPLFSFNINSRDLAHFSYMRYLENKIREAFDFEGTSLKFIFNEKREGR
ncbi:ribosome biogenesis GTPase Der [Alterileibacterium massiliense]|uniref:ribosome biogenesis GTPase Der n=1 Tax=Alterileibacterium massiliense TaxID=1870997 RepID=UPI0008D9D65F|nr:ribosome biogenesis GTPase Der [Alterileibacterium massiliense]